MCLAPVVDHIIRLRTFLFQHAVACVTKRTRQTRIVFNVVSFVTLELAIAITRVSVRTV